MTDTPAAWHFMGAYLNEDWTDDYDDVWGAVDAFVVESPSLAPQLPAELDRILMELTTESELDAWLSGQGASYAPRAEGATYRAFLEAVAQRVRRSTEAKG